MVPFGDRGACDIDVLRKDEDLIFDCKLMEGCRCFRGVSLSVSGDCSPGMSVSSAVGASVGVASPSFAASDCSAEGFVASLSSGVASVVFSVFVMLDFLSVPFAFCSSLY